MTREETTQAIVGYDILAFKENDKEISFEIDSAGAITLAQLNTLARSWRATSIEMSAIGHEDGDATIMVIATK